MTAIAARDLRIGDVLRLRKGHACGGDRWTVVRLGADIGLRCNTCERRVLIDRNLIERRIATVIERGSGPTADEVMERIQGLSPVDNRD